MLISPISFLIKYVQIFGGLSFTSLINSIYGISYLPWIWYYVFGIKMSQLGNKRIRFVIILLAISICLQIGEGYACYMTG